MSKHLLLVILPGGPGLTCDTLQDLIQNFSPDEVLALDPSSGIADWSYGGLLSDLQSRIPTDRPIAICGHSFGGIQAVDLALRLRNVSALICMATPFSLQAWNSISAEFVKHSTPELVTAGEAFDREATNENFKEWVANYGTLYFTLRNVPRGREMIRRSRTSLEAYNGAGTEASQKGFLLERIRSSSIPKLFLYGELDGLVVSEIAKREADAGGFIAKEIKDASHFMAFDQPELTTNAINDFLKSSFNQGGQL